MMTASLRATAAYGFAALYALSANGGALLFAPVAAALVLALAVDLGAAERVRRKPQDGESAAKPTI